MKIFATLLAACTAAPTDWIVANWWTEANNVYEFAVGNHEKFASVVAAQDNAAYLPLWEFCGGADGVLTGAELTNCGKKMSQFVGMSGGKRTIFVNLYKEAIFKVPKTFCTTLQQSTGMLLMPMHPPTLTSLNSKWPLAH